MTNKCKLLNKKKCKKLCSLKTGKPKKGNKNIKNIKNIKKKCKKCVKKYAPTKTKILKRTIPKTRQPKKTKISKRIVPKTRQNYKHVIPNLSIRSSTPWFSLNHTHFQPTMHYNRPQINEIDLREMINPPILEQPRHHPRINQPRNIPRNEPRAQPRNQPRVNQPNVQPRVNQRENNQQNQRQVNQNIVQPRRNPRRAVRGQQIDQPRRNPIRGVRPPVQHNQPEQGYQHFLNVLNTAFPDSSNNRTYAERLRTRHKNLGFPQSKNWIIEHKGDLFRNIDNMKSAKDQYSAFVKYLEADLGDRDNIHFREYKNKMTRAISKSKKLRRKAGLSENQAKEWFNLTSLKDIYDVRVETKRSKKDKQKTMLVGMLVHQPPRRTKELAKLKYSEGNPDDYPISSNYIFRDDNKFKMHLNVYKNKKHMGSRTIDLQPEIQTRLTDLVPRLRDNESVFGTTTKKTLNKYFKDIVADKGVTVRTARNVYVTDKLNSFDFERPNIVQKIETLAHDMGHSTKTLLRDYWKVDPKEKKRVKKLLEGEGSDDESSE